MQVLDATAMLNFTKSALNMTSALGLQACLLVAAVAGVSNCARTPRAEPQYHPVVALANVRSPLEFGVLTARRVFPDIPWCRTYVVTANLLEQTTLDILDWNDLRPLRPLTEAELDALGSALKPLTRRRADSSRVQDHTCLVNVAQVVKVASDHRFRIFIGAPYPTICEVRVDGNGPSTWRVTNAGCLDS